MINLVEFTGTVVGVKKEENGSFIFVKTDEGSFERLFDDGCEYRYLEVGTTGTFLVDGLTVFSTTYNLDTRLRLLKFVEDH